MCECGWVCVSVCECVCECACVCVCKLRRLKAKDILMFFVVAHLGYCVSSVNCDNLL